MTTTDSTTLDGTPETPLSDGSQGQVQQGSESVNITKREWDELQKTLKRLDDETRSNKDRAVKKTNEKLEALEEKLSPVFENFAKLIQEGKSPNEAYAKVKSEQDEAEDKQALRELAQAVKSGTLSSLFAGNKQETDVNVDEVIAEYGLDGNSIEVRAAFNRKFGSREEAEVTAARLLKPKPVPSEATFTSPPSSPKQPPNVEALNIELERLSKTPTAPGALKRMEEIQKLLG